MSEPSDGVPSASYRDGNQESIVNLVAWVFTITAICTIVFVLSHKMYTQRRKWPHVDEIVLIFTGIFDFVQATASAWENTNGFGMNVDHFSPSAFESLQKSQYFKSFMYITVIGLAKISTLRTFHELTPQKPHRFLIRSTKILVSLCCVSSLVSLGVQCLPRPWDTTHGTCINRAALWIFVAIWDIFTDVAIVTMAFLILRTLDINRSSRRCCLLAFTIRLLCIPAALVHVVYIVRYTRAQHFTKAVYTVALAGQTQYLISILATSMPHITVLADPLRDAYLAAVTQQPDLSVRLSWPQKAKGRLSLCPFCFSRRQAVRSPPLTSRAYVVGSAYNVDQGRVEELGLAPLGTAMAMAGRASESSETDARGPSRTRSRNRDSTDDGGIKTKEWTVQTISRD